jgi:predicted secreted protein
MPIGSLIAIYFVVWWIALFAVLPFARGQSDDVDVPGSDPGAPGRFLVVRAVVLTSILAAVLVGAFLAVRAAGFGLDDVPFLPAPG